MFGQKPIRCLFNSHSHKNSRGDGHIRSGFQSSGEVVWTHRPTGKWASNPYRRTTAEDMEMHSKLGKCMWTAGKPHCLSLSLFVFFCLLSFYFFHNQKQQRDKGPPSAAPLHFLKTYKMQRWVERFPYLSLHLSLPRRSPLLPLLLRHDPLVRALQDGGIKTRGSLLLPAVTVSAVAAATTAAAQQELLVRHPLGKVPVLFAEGKGVRPSSPGLGRCVSVHGLQQQRGQLCTHSHTHSPMTRDMTAPGIARTGSRRPCAPRAARRCPAPPVFFGGVGCRAHRAKRKRR